MSKVQWQTVKNKCPPLSNKPPERYSILSSAATLRKCCQSFANIPTRFQGAVKHFLVPLDENTSKSFPFPPDPFSALMRCSAVRGDRLVCVCVCVCVSVRACVCSGGLVISVLCQLMRDRGATCSGVLGGERWDGIWGWGMCWGFGD